MNILYIIGNGLDIAHHLKTSYQDFFKYYVALPSSDDDILRMKKDIDQQKNETWADLEIGMGVYAGKCDSKDVFLKCLDNIKSSLKDYLRRESEKISNFITSSIISFASPSGFLEPEPRTRYNEFANQINPNVRIDVITLNYTNTLEYLLDFDGKEKVLTRSTSLRTIFHLHGTLENMMVMGVNDISQIGNERFNSDEDVMEEFIKPEYNDACLNNKNAICESLINDADIIVLFGTSLGPSDDKWWKLIGQRMDSAKYPLLVYLPYDAKKNPAAEPNHLRRWTRGYVREIRSKFGIKLEEDILASRICVAINQQLFPLKRIQIEAGHTK